VELPEAEQHPVHRRNRTWRDGIESGEDDRRWRLHEDPAPATAELESATGLGVAAVGSHFEEEREESDDGDRDPDPDCRAVDLELGHGAESYPKNWRLSASRAKVAVEARRCIKSIVFSSGTTKAA